jgi:hypothetical protein
LLELTNVPDSSIKIFIVSMALTLRVRRRALTLK